MSILSNHIGKRGERIAARFLKKQGFRILETNRRQSHNEIDLIAADRDYVVFAEVKTRSCDSDLFLPRSPASFVDRDKQRRTIWAAERYLAEHPELQKQPRMDVIEVYLDKGTRKTLKIHHIPNAYGKK